MSDNLHIGVPTKTRKYASRIHELKTNSHTIHERHPKGPVNMIAHGVQIGNYCPEPA